MIGIIVELLLSWLLLWWLYKKGLAVLGFLPTENRLSHFLFGLLLAGVCCMLYHVMSTGFAEGNGWVNKHMPAREALKSFGWTLKSVLFEELAFRGALLYILIRKLGERKACLISAACFGVMHWFTFNSFGNPVQMLIIFCMTGLMGYVLALAYSKTRSLYLPIALHLGWNFVNIVVFSNGPLGQQMFVKMNGNKAEGLVSLLIFLFQVFALPVLGYFYVKYLVPRAESAEGDF